MYALSAADSEWWHIIAMFVRMQRVKRELDDLLHHVDEPILHHDDTLRLVTRAILVVIDRRVWVLDHALADVDDVELMRSLRKEHVAVVDRVPERDDRDWYC